MKKVLMGLVLAVGVVSTAYAQLHGMGRIDGSCTEDGGGPMEGVTVKATLTGTAGAGERGGDKKGEWILGGMARGDWDVTFEKAGYVTRKAKVSLTVELARMPPIAVAMKKQ